MKPTSLKWTVVLIVLAVSMFQLPISGGDLNPPGPPAPTMKPLNEIEPRQPISSDMVPVTISESGSFYLLEDIQVTDSAMSAITINVDNVTIDLNGFTIKGPETGTGNGIQIVNGQHYNIEIKNGTVRDFGNDGIYSGYCCENALRVISVRVIGNGEYGIQLHGDAIIKDCTVIDNDSGGIYLGAGYILGQVVTGNVVSGNDGIGIACSGPSIVKENLVTGNDGEGISVADSIVMSNTVSNNTLTGIALGGDCLVDKNTAIWNGTPNIGPCGSCTFGLNHAP